MDPLPAWMKAWLVLCTVVGIVIWALIILTLISAVHFMNKPTSHTSDPLVGAPYDWQPADQGWVPRRYRHQPDRGWGKEPIVFYKW